MVKNQCLRNQHLAASDHAAPVDIGRELGLGVGYGIKTFPVGDPYPRREVLQERGVPAALGVRVARRFLGRRRQPVAFSEEPHVGVGEGPGAAEETPHGAVAHDPPQNPGPSMGHGGVGRQPAPGRRGGGGGALVRLEDGEDAGEERGLALLRAAVLLRGGRGGGGGGYGGVSAVR